MTVAATHIPWPLTAVALIVAAGVVFCALGATFGRGGR